MRRALIPAGLLAALSATLIAPARADIHLVPEPSGPLAGRTIVFSPGHGYYLDGGTWRYQRGVGHDVREDVHTNELFIEYVQRYLTGAGARVESVRERSFQRHEVVLDDAQALETGGWTSSTSAPAFHGAGYRYSTVALSETATSEFRATLPQSGSYPVYVWYTQSPNRSRDARFTVHHSGGATVVLVDQSRLGDQWHFLGEFHFDAATPARVVLSNEGSDPSKVVIADAVRFGGGVGASGAVRWREAAQQFLRYKGFSSTAGDVTIRPRYGTWLAGGDTSRWRADFLYFALHTNASGGSGTARGLSTFSYSNGRTPSWGSAGAVTYPTSPSPLQAQSDALRDAVHAAVLEAVRAEFDAAWPDRGAHLMNFGELRESRTMPSCLIELGFHDNVDDAGLLADARFRAAAARAIYKGILRYWAPSATVIPLPVREVSLLNLGGGALRASWAPALDPLEPSAAATAFKVYLSRDGRGFDDGRQVATTSVDLTGFAPGERVFVRVAPLNAGGEGLPSRVAGAVVGSPAGALVVDGFHRAFRHTHENVAARFGPDDAVAHVDALAAALPAGVGVDGTSNEAVLRGTVALGAYPLVDWLLGREGSLDRTFDGGEQALVETYLQAGGALLVSGTELGWDLEARGGGTRFLNDVLGVDYLADDGGARTVRPAPGGPVGALGALVLHDGQAGRYDVASPDVLAPFHAGARLAFAYEAAGAPAAGVLQEAPYRVLALGFPLEGVQDDGQRRLLAAEAVRLLLPAPPTPPAGGGAPPASGGGGAPASSGSSGGTAGSTASPSTAGPAPTASGGGGGGGGCALTPTGAAPSPAPSLLLLALLGLALRRRAARAR